LEKSIFMGVAGRRPGYREVPGLVVGDLQPDRQVEAELEAFGVHVVADRLDAVRESGRVGLRDAVAVVLRLPLVVHPPARVDVDVGVAVRLELRSHDVGVGDDLRLGERAAVAGRVDAGIGGGFQAPTAPAHVGLRGDVVVPACAGGSRRARRVREFDQAEHRQCAEQDRERGRAPRPSDRYTHTDSLR
jgi:hypothetical protein